MILRFPRALPALVILELLMGVEPMTSSLPRTCSTTEPQQLFKTIHPGTRGKLTRLERVMGIEPTRPAWKAGALPLSYTRPLRHRLNQDGLNSLKQSLGHHDESRRLSICLITMVVLLFPAHR